MIFEMSKLHVCKHDETHMFSACLQVCEGEEEEADGTDAIEENCEARPRAAVQHLVQREASELAALDVPLEMNLPDVSLKV
jgi:hypothetical protein